MVDGWDPATGVYEQFAGFAKLEPLIIKEVAPHRPIAADLLLGTDRVHGAQVVKQADVLMAHHLVPDEVVTGSLEANLRFYEPRTAHGSSLSPSVHASLLARAGDFATRRRSPGHCQPDRPQRPHRLDRRRPPPRRHGWALAGVRLRILRASPPRRAVHVDPHLPPKWSALEIRVRFRGRPVRFRAEKTMLSIHTDAPVDIVIDVTT
jgi:trehalose/maltose hydrolase-like predicted phosphorylase